MSPMQDNIFGPNYSVEDTDSAVRAFGIQSTDRVLDVGGAGNPFLRADVVCDLTFGCSAQRNGSPPALREGVTHVEAIVENLPFADNEFDFVYCTQVLEHVADPVAACRELSRVARRGFIEVPSRMSEMLHGNPSHRWLIDRDNDTLVFCARRFVDHPLNNFLYGVAAGSDALHELLEDTYRNVFNHQVLFEGELICRVESDSGSGDRFDYDDEAQAAQAHYSFARNALMSGADTRYALPDATLAARLLPGSAHAASILALYRLRLLEPDKAMEVLEGHTGSYVETLRQLASDMSSGVVVDIMAHPLPPADSSGPTVNRKRRPMVSVLVAGADVDALRQSAESALTQDYPYLEVVVAAAASEAELTAAFHELIMPDRLHLFAYGPDATPGTCLNLGGLETRGDVIGFLEAGDRYMPRHIDRMVAALVSGDAIGVHGDHLSKSAGGVVGVDVIPDDPQSTGASLSTLVADKKLMIPCGPFDDKSDAAVGFRFLVRLARLQPLIHIREVTVETQCSLPPDAILLDSVEAGTRFDVYELTRLLMTAHVREEALRAQIADKTRGN